MLRRAGHKIKLTRTLKRLYPNTLLRRGADDDSQALVADFYVERIA